MKELNPIIRQAVYNILKYIKLRSKLKYSSEREAAKCIINFQRQLIPDYWDLPTVEAFREDILSLIQALNLQPSPTFNSALNQRLQKKIRWVCTPACRPKTTKKSTSDGVAKVM